MDELFEFYHQSRKRPPSSLSPHHIKKCPKCQSLFITEKECESCGHQLSFDPLGPPFGERSFYDLKDNYWQKQGLLVRLFPSWESKKSVKAKRYRRFLLHRLQVLAEVEAAKAGESKKGRMDDYLWSLYLIEIKDLRIELQEYDTSQDSDWPLSFLNFRLFGHFRVGMALVFSLMLSAGVIFSYLHLSSLLAPP